MKCKYEFIEYHKSLPLNIFVYEKADDYITWHKEIEILFVLRGKATVNIKDQTYHLYAKDILLINRNEIHRITQVDSDTIILSLLLNPYFYEVYYDGFSDIYFERHSLLEDKTEDKYSYLRNKISNIMIHLLSLNKTYQINLLSESLELIAYLVENFRKDTTGVNVITDDYLHQRFSRILEYLMKNYDKKITLSDLAKTEYISIYYLSRLFSEHMGIGFNKYLNMLRLDKSMYDLVNTNKSILEIAIDNGFSSAKAYRTVFKENYNMTPNDYRKQLFTTEESQEEKIKFTKGATALLDILHNYQADPVATNKNEPNTLEIEVDDMSAKNKQWISFEKILYFDYVYDELNINWQTNLEKIHNEINFDYIRFSGIFNHGMYFYDEKEKVYNWFNVDNILDFFVNKKIKPFIKFSYNKKEFTIKSWHIMLENFIQHCIKRYGLSNVKEWKFEFAHQDRSYSKMIELYSKSLDYFQEKFDKLKYGIEFIPSSNFHEEYFLENFKNKHLHFISVEMTEEMYNERKGFVKILFNSIKNLRLKTYFIKTESRNYFNDTCFKANKLIHDFLNEHHGIDAPVNFIDHLKTTKLFHGGLGLLTYNGLKKPVYHAYYLLDKLKGYVICNGSNHYVVKNENKIIILLYSNFEQVDEQPSTIDFYERNRTASNNDSLLIKLRMNLEQGKYKLKSYTLDKENGSVFDEWINMGKPEDFDNEEFNFIKSKEIMRLKSATIDVQDELLLKQLLPANGVKLIEVTKA